MKLIVQIPCLNEESDLAGVIESIPRSIPGIDEIEIIVIDDGSEDSTSDVARRHGATSVIRHKKVRGLAEAFRTGADYAVSAGADILVNTDGDNQYPQESIPELIKPIVEGYADVVIGDRSTAQLEHFSWAKKRLQSFGTKVVNSVAGTKVNDATSGFRAYSRLALLNLNLHTKFSYVIESLAQAGQKGLLVVDVKIAPKPTTRDSRLFRSTGEHVLKSGWAIIRLSVMYRPYPLFGFIALFFAIGGAIPFLRFIVNFVLETGAQLVQSLILGTVLLTASLLALVLGVVSDMIRINRHFIEDGLAIQKAHQSRVSLSNGPVK